jgi:hypothetical protein
MMLVGAPGISSSISTGSVYAYVVSFGTGTFTSTTGISRGGQGIASAVLSGLTTADKSNTSTISLSFSNPETSNGVPATGIISWLTTSTTATATATSIIITSPGWGYLQAPTVLIIGNTTGTNGTVTTTLKNETVVNDHPELFEIKPNSILYAGDQWGHKIAGSPDSSRIAISAPGKFNTSTGVVEIFNNNLQYLQTLSHLTGKFGYDVAMSTNYLIISAPEFKETNEPYGKVDIYKLTNLTSTGTYTLVQTIVNPLPTNDLKFGYSISISKDEKTIGISALGKTRSQDQIFDEYNNSGKTTFDNNSTKFNESLPDAGTVYLYNKIGNKFIQADELNDVRIIEDVTEASIIPFDIPTQAPTAPVITNIELSENPANIGNTIVVTFHTDVDIKYIIGQVDGLTYGPYGGTIQNSPNRDHYFYIDTTRFPAGIRNLVIYAQNALTDVWGAGYTTFTLEPAVYTISAGSRYGSAVVVTNNGVFVGAPTNQSNLLPAPATDASRLFIFNKVNTNSLSWNVLREQSDLVDISTVGRVALIDTLKEEIIDYLDVIDPVKGKIAGIAEQELKYKAAFDPATYSIGLAGTIVNTETNWLDEHVGELWWDLSTAKYTWYEQGDEIFRKNNWGRLFPGASIDVYEWVKSDLLPSEWAAQADTTKGLTNSISGQPKYPDNSVISVKQVFNNVTGAFENVYYFWVKNKVTLPSVKNRRLSSYQVSNYIADPVANGLKFIEILSPDTVAFANVQPLLVGNRINANISTHYYSSTPTHTEWLLLNERDHTSLPNTLLEKKLFDSLLGHDSLGTVVPSKSLTYRNRYGIGIRPQQTLFKDRLAALRNLISFVNSVLLENRIVGNYSFENLNKVEEIPALLSYEYDAIVEDTAALDEVFTVNYIRASLECYAENGKIKNVTIINPGFGYTIAPKVKILSAGTSVGEIVTELNSEGKIISATITNVGAGYQDGLLKIEVRPHTIIVQANADYNGRWTKHSFNYSLRVWVRTQTQKYNTPLFWKTVDWVNSTYDAYKTVGYTISNLFELGSLTSIANSDYVKVKNIGDGKYAILQKVEAAGNYIPSYDIVYREQGTIQLLDTLWDYSLGKYAYDSATIEETLYDQIPDQELYYILTALKDNIFINSLKVNWNLFFFAAVKYALTEQKLLDWAFKTSFINVFNNIGTLDQRPVYKLNNEEYFESYINEIKPYHTKIRSYTSIYDKIEQSNLYTTDFDLPSYYNTVSDSLEVVGLGDPLLDTYPWKSWADNYKFYVGAIEVGYAGTGYTQRPTVTITTATSDTGSGATAEAYIRNGEVYKVLVTNPGAGYVIPPIVTISNSNVGNDPARVSVIMSNDTVRKNIIGMKFDRTSTVGDIVDLTVTDEFVCDGTLDKFTLTWLASPDKRTITPLLDGKLIFGADYTIEYYQVKVSQTGIDIPQAFPRNSWEGERMVDHRYKYFLNTERSGELPGYIRHYAKFVFLNQVPTYGQVFKITYNKNIDLYNAVDRINSLYNPSDLMPGKELPLLLNGAEYPGISVQGLLFNQTPNWDNTGTGFDSAPWGETVNSYAVTKLLGDLDVNQTQFTVSSLDGIFAGQTIVPLNTSTQIFKPTTIVSGVGPGNKVYVTTLDLVDTQIKRIFSTYTISGLSGTTLVGSGAEFNIIDTGTGTYSISTVTNSGLNYRIGHKIKISGSALGGVDGVNDAIITVDNNSPSPIVGYASIVEGTAAGTSYTVYTNITGTNYQVGSNATFDLIVDNTGYNVRVSSTGTGGANYVFRDKILIDGNTIGFRNTGTNNITLTVNDLTDTSIRIVTSEGVIQSGSPAGSTIIINTKDSFNTAISVGDLVAVVGVNSLYGYGIRSVSTLTTIMSTSTTSLVTVTFPPPNYPSGRQAYATVVQDGFTVTNIIVTDPGMGYGPSYTNVSATFSGTTVVVTALDYEISLDPGFNQAIGITKTANNYLEGISDLELSSLGTTLQSDAHVNLTSIINKLDANNKLLDTVVETFSSATVLSLQTFAPYVDVRRAAVTLSTTSTEILSTTTNTLWYSISNSIDGLNRAVVSVRSIDPSVTLSGELDVRVYGSTELEFYSYNSNYNSLDSMISGTNLYDTNLGYKPEDIVIDGNNFLNSVDSYAPEECVPGLVRDAVGINVYTTVEPLTYPLVVSGAFAAGPSGVTRAELTWLPDAPLGFRVQANGRTFEKVFNENSFTTSTQYCMFGNTIVVNTQPANTLVGYSFVTAGSNTIVDSNYVGTEVVSQGNTGTIAVSSLLPIDEVLSVYVLLNGDVIGESPNPEDISVRGFVLSPTSSVNNRAMITVNGLTSNLYNLEAWFFNQLYPKFNTMHEQFFTVGSTATSELFLERAPGGIEPLSEQVIVEKITDTTRERLLPPWASYYKIRNGVMTYPIDSKNSRPSTYNLNNVKVYVNGIELRPGYDFTVNTINETITLIKPGIVAGDAIAILPLVDYDYFLTGNALSLSTPVTTATIKVTSFTDHDNMMIRTERFKGTDELILTFPVLNENYVWVTIENKQLTAGFDYFVREDMRTIELSEFVNIKLTDDIVVVVINPPSYGTKILGHRIFKDMFGRQQFRRISEYFSTKLAQPLQYTDDKIFVEHGDHLLQPNPGRNLPGVILVDSERIEYTAKDGNVLSGLRRSTLGTGPAKFSDIGTEVIDQSIRQIIPTVDYSLIQNIPSSNTTTYTISTVTNTSTFVTTTSTHAGNGIIFSTLTNAIDQVEVYYGGRQLRKTSLIVHDKSRSYYTMASVQVNGVTTSSYETLPPEFTITTSTQQITLNIAEEITTGTRITVVKKEGAFWENASATSLVSSTGTQANFIRSRPAELPDIYYYGGEKVLLENSVALTDENGEPLEGY